jgi:hypothetical protein
MITSVATFVVLPSDVESDVAGLADAHAAFDPERRRVVRIDQETTWPQTVVALAVRNDGAVCATFTRAQALNEAWIEDGFVRCTRPSRSID